MTSHFSYDPFKYKRFVNEELCANYDLNPTAQDANAETLQTYIVQRISWYFENKYTSVDLREIYREDFKSWTPSMMDMCKTDLLFLLRDFLVKNGVSIPRDKRRIAIRLLDDTEIEANHDLSKEKRVVDIEKEVEISSIYIPYTPPHTNSRGIRR